MRKRTEFFENDWADPYSLEPRPMHCATEAEQEQLEERLMELGMLASHIGATMSVNVSYRKKTRARRVKP